MYALALTSLLVVASSARPSGPRGYASIRNAANNYYVQNQDENFVGLDSQLPGEDARVRLGRNGFVGNQGWLRNNAGECIGVKKSDEYKTLMWFPCEDYANNDYWYTWKQGNFGELQLKNVGPNKCLTANDWDLQLKKCLNRKDVTQTWTFKVESPVTPTPTPTPPVTTGYAKVKNAAKGYYLHLDDGNFAGVDLTNPNILVRLGRNGFAVGGEGWLRSKDGLCLGVKKDDTYRTPMWFSCEDYANESYWYTWKQGSFGELELENAGPNKQRVCLTTMDWNLSMDSCIGQEDATQRWSFEK